MSRHKEGLVALIRTRVALIFDPSNESGHKSTRYCMWQNQETGTLFDLLCIASNWYESYLALRYCSELPPFQEGWVLLCIDGLYYIFWDLCASVTLIIDPHVYLYSKRFTGYGENKNTVSSKLNGLQLYFILYWLNWHLHQSETVCAQWAMQLCKVGYKFSQIGGVFLVDYPHSSSKACQEWNKLSDESRAADGKKRRPSEALNEEIRPCVFTDSWLDTGSEKYLLRAGPVNERVTDVSFPNLLLPCPCLFR